MFIFKGMRAFLKIQCKVCNCKYSVILSQNKQHVNDSGCFVGCFFFFFGCSCCLGAELFEFSAFLEPILPLQRNEGSAEESAVWKISGLEIRMILSFREKYRFELRENVQMGF